MPRDAPVSKVAAAERLGASVEVGGTSVEEALGLAREWAHSTGAALVHPFDDLDVIAGQGTIALELLEDVPDLARVVVPVGGGGLASGIGIALRRGAAVAPRNAGRPARAHLHVRETGVELTLETRGRAHTGEILALLTQASYEVRSEEANAER